MTRFNPYQRRLKPYARSLRREATVAENKLWYQYLKHLPERFTRQKPLDRYIADFYCSSHRLVVEVDGDSHYDARGERRDQERTRALEAMGLRVVRFTNDDVRERFEAVCLEIRAVLDG